MYAYCIFFNFRFCSKQIGTLQTLRYLIYNWNFIQPAQTVGHRWPKYYNKFKSSVGLRAGSITVNNRNKSKSVYLYFQSNSIKILNFDSISFVTDIPWNCKCFRNTGYKYPSENKVRKGSIAKGLKLFGNIFQDGSSWVLENTGLRKAFFRIVWPNL